MLVVVQCRFGSTRLPGKCMYPLLGMPMLSFLLRRLKPAGLAARLVLATTQGPEDDIVAAWGRAEGVDVVRGERDDVLARYLRCLSLQPAKGVIRVTADNPLTHPRAIARTLEALATGSWDYVSAVAAYPRGMGVDGFSAGALRKIAAATREPRHLEHLNAYILEHPGQFRSLELAGEEAWPPELDLSIDTREDWQRVTGFVQYQNPPGGPGHGASGHHSHPV